MENKESVNAEGVNPSKQEDINEFNKKKPVKVFRAGKIVIRVWENTSNEGKKFRTCNIKKSYTDKEGNWKNVQNFSKRDLTEIAFCCGKAYNEFEN